MRAKNWPTRVVHQASAVTAYQEAVKVSTQRYQMGQSSYYEVLEEQQLLFPAQNTLVQIQLGQINSIIQLYRSPRRRLAGSG